MRIAVRLTVSMDRGRNDATLLLCLLCVWVCTCYLISPETSAHPMDPVGKGGVSLCMCLGQKSWDIEGAKGLRAAASVATVYKYIHLHNRFVFSGGGGASSQCTDL